MNYASGRPRVHTDSPMSSIRDAIVEYVTKSVEHPQEPLALQLVETATDLCDELCIRMEQEQEASGR